MINFCEVEFKYRAEGITLSKFTEFCESLNPKKIIVAAGYDYFYQKKGDDSSFCRHRLGPDSNQLTFKRKTTDSNNFIRTEHNLDLRGVSKEQIRAFLADMSYDYNLSLYKNCFVYRYDWYTFVYYICYDLEMKEVGRFVEIEMSEEHDWADEADAWNELIVLEKIGKVIGLSPQARVKRSLFELYKK